MFPCSQIGRREKRETSLDAVKLFFLSLKLKLLVLQQIREVKYCLTQILHVQVEKATKIMGADFLYLFHRSHLISCLCLTLQLYIHFYFWSLNFKLSDVELLRILHTRKISLNKDGLQRKMRGKEYISHLHEESKT